MEERKNSKLGLGIIIGMMISAAIGLGAYFICDNYVFDKKDNKNDTEVKPTPSATPTATPTPSATPTSTYDLSKFDGTKAINGSEGWKYEISNVVNDFSKKGLTASIGSDKKSATLTINWDITDDNITGGRVIDGGTRNYTATFTKELKKVIIDGYGQWSGNELVLYLFDDGTVEYTRVKEFLKNAGNNESNIMSSSKLNVNDIAEIIGADCNGINEQYVGGYYTPIAIKNDGTFYDISKLFTSNN